MLRFNWKILIFHYKNQKQNFPPLYVNFTGGLANQSQIYWNTAAPKIYVFHVNSIIKRSDAKIFTCIMHVNLSFVSRHARTPTHSPQKKYHTIKIILRLVNLSVPPKWKKKNSNDSATERHLQICNNDELYSFSFINSVESPLSLREVGIQGSEKQDKLENT